MAEEHRALDYAGALEVLGLALTFGINPTLERVEVLCERLGRPQDAFECVQIAGTNGKTSTARLAAAAVRSQGKLVGLYTSPHLERYPERIEIDGTIVSDDDFASAVAAAVQAARSGPVSGDPLDEVTEFELLTAAALWLFRERGVDVAVLEVGLGGRWDATSVVTPAVAVITGIGLDHTAVLGGTLEEIAAEKSGVIDEGSIVVLGPGTRAVDALLLEQARGRGARRVVAVREEGEGSPLPEEATVRYRGGSGRAGSIECVVILNSSETVEVEMRAPAFQLPNIATAVTAAEALLGPLSAGRVAAELQRVRFPGRFEQVSASPRIVLDGAHNPEAAGVLAATLDAEFDRPPLAVLGVLADKDAAGIVSALVGHVSGFAVAAPATHRALLAPELASLVSRIASSPVTVHADVASAVRWAAASSLAGVIVTGSLYAVGEARRALGGGADGFGSGTAVSGREPLC